MASARSKGSRGSRGLLLSVATAAAIVAYGPDARAVTFPTSWTVLTFTGVPMGDDTTDAAGERNIVGDTANPAAFVAMDSTYLYFRVRVDGDPRFADGTFRPHGWGCLVDADSDPKTVEFLALVNGITSKGPDDKPDQVEWRFNSTKSADAIDDNIETLVQAYPAAEPAGHARVTVAGSMFSGNPDYFVDWAIPLSVIRTPPAASGAPPVPDGTPMRFLCGTSVGTTRVDSDPMGTSTTFSGGSSDPVFCGPTGCYTDRDGDTVPDSTETALGTNPTNPDSDGDGIRDNIELSATGGAGPFVGIDTDGDGTIDALDTDSDGDTHADSVETALDSDGDGRGNWRDLDSDNDCVLDRNETVAGLRDPAAPSASPTMNCTAPLVCDTGSGICVAPPDGGGADTGGTTTDTGGTTTDTGGTTADTGGRTTDTGATTDGSATDGSVTDGSVTDGADTGSGDDTGGGDDTGAVIDTGLGETGNLGDSGGDGGALDEAGVLEGGGCACATPGTAERSASLGALAGLGLLLATASRRRKR